MNGSDLGYERFRLRKVEVRWWGR